MLETDINLKKEPRKNREDGLEKFNKTALLE
jgi:hypothetical protein